MTISSRALILFSFILLLNRSTTFKKCSGDWVIGTRRAPVSPVVHPLNINSDNVALARWFRWLEHRPVYQKRLQV